MGELPRRSAWITWSALAAILVFGAWVRAAAASWAAPHPDEVLHYMAAAEPDTGAVLRASRAHAHPPLFFLVLHAWMAIFGSGEVAMRLLPGAAGVASIAIVFLWMRGACGPAAGLAAAAIWAASAQCIDLSSQVRGYSLLQLALLAALLGQHLYARGGRAAWLGASVAAMAAAVLTHFSAILAFPAVAAVGWAELPARGRRKWALAHVVTAAAIAYAGATQIAALRGGEMERDAIDGWLRAGYFHTGDGSGAAGFLAARLWAHLGGLAGLALEQYFPPAGRAALAAAAPAAVLWMAVKRWPMRWPAIAAAAAYGVAAAAALAGAYPFGGTRHSSYLAVFLIPLAGAAMAALLRHRIVPVAALSALGIAGYAQLFPFRVLVRGQPEPHMEAAREAALHLRDDVRPGDTVFSDSWSILMLAYYWSAEPLPAAMQPAGNPCQRCYRADGIRLIGAPRTFTFGSAGTLAHALRLHRAAEPGAGGVWCAVLEEASLSDGLAAEAPDLRIASRRRFTRRIEYFRVAW